MKMLPVVCNMGSVRIVKDMAFTDCYHAQRQTLSGIWVNVDAYPLTLKDVIRVFTEHMETEDMLINDHFDEDKATKATPVYEDMTA